jgi:hypothetical protein
VSNRYSASQCYLFKTIFCCVVNIEVQDEPIGARDVWVKHVFGESKCISSPCHVALTPEGEHKEYFSSYLQSDVRHKREKAHECR